MSGPASLGSGIGRGPSRIRDIGSRYVRDTAHQEPAGPGCGRGVPLCARTASTAISPGTPPASTCVRYPECRTSCTDPAHTALDSAPSRRARPPMPARKENDQGTRPHPNLSHSPKPPNPTHQGLPNPPTTEVAAAEWMVGLGCPWRVGSAALVDGGLSSPFPLGSAAWAGGWVGPALLRWGWRRWWMAGLGEPVHLGLALPLALALCLRPPVLVLSQ
jgi:hypothetical protein